MKNFTKSVLITFLTLSSTYADLMFFDVMEGQMEKENASSKVLKGDVLARDVQVEFATERFEIEKVSGAGIDASVEWNDANSIFSIKKDGLKFSTAVAQGLGISGLENVSLKEAQVRLDESGISMKGQSLAFSHENFRTSLSGAKIFCPTGGVFRTEIDQVCLQVSQSEIGRIEYQQNVFDADFIKAKADITDSQFSLSSKEAIFNDKIQTFVDSFSLSCQKLPMSLKALTVDTFSILQGCLKRSDVSISQMNMSGEEVALLKEALLESGKVTEKDFQNKDLVDLDHLKEISLKMRNGKMNLEARVKAIFWVKVRLAAMMKLDTKKRELLIKIDDARVLGVPVRRLAYRLVKKFGRVDYIEIRGDLIVFKL